MQQDQLSGRLLADVPIFSGIAPAALDHLAPQTWLRSFPDGQVLASEGDPGESLLVLESGQVRISRYTPSGHEVVLAIVDAPASFGELALIDGAPRSATITAQSPVIVRIVPRQAFVSLIENDVHAAMAVLHSVTGMVRATNERLADVLSLDVPGRVAKWLLARAAGRGIRAERGIRVPFDLSQRDLASELGTTRVSINKALKSFEALQAIELQRDEILILKPDLLIEYTY
jgi:CRP/FNR family transcriptional regulator, cyclic AMP receptor protein